MSEASATQPPEYEALSPNTDAFSSEYPQVAEMYRRAFAGYPWFENLSPEEVRSRLSDQMAQPGFTAFITHNEQGVVSGGLWYDTPSLDTLGQQRGKPLYQFARAAMRGVDQPVVWEREVLVHPDSQGRGVGTHLRMALLGHLAIAYPDGALLLTRMRDDNHGIVRIAEKVGYARTGVRTPSLVHPTAPNEYWYHKIKSVR